MSTTEENKAQFRRTYEQVLNQGDLSVVEELIAPDFLNHAAPPGRDRGPESLRWLATMLRTAFPDLRFTIEELVAEGDIVAGRLTMSGTHEGPLTGMPTTGRAVRQAHMHFVRYQGGKAVEHWGVRDDLGMMQQMGLIPEPGQRGGSRPNVDLIHRSSWKECSAKFRRLGGVAFLGGLLWRGQNAHLLHRL